MICARHVFRCFKWLERMGDRFTGAAGPYFVGLAIILQTIGAASFFTVIQPNLPLPWLTTPPCLLIALNLFVHYYYVCTVPPGFVQDEPSQPGDSLLWASLSRTSPSSGVWWSNCGIILYTASTSQCRRCGMMRPERAHHCRICGRCVMKYDHHCPPFSGINQCVGLHNERHFVLFMAYLVLSTFWLSILGYSQALEALGLNFTNHWPYMVPQLAYILTYMLSVVLCISVFIMLSWHLWAVARGETSVEAQDHEVYKRIAKDRGDHFVNSYDLGKSTNLRLFFNVGRGGYPWYTLILPLRIMPYTDGCSWARREGLERHLGIQEGEELTDEDDNDDE
ncbi:zf-DHHC-domain-containing protein [Rhizopogon vinicolor AM-OR11-026]|uniref:Palmitoyltransferase n=1 Tax=Rhizopogon vinicolor AM-OR11-026 TaxID=1314800 RepID=A0A1B7ND73_9AGAM|nr:zf-DHHC-domain-containing protein [Rhizopogon vinicolor AM-OR11-026]